MVASQHEGRKPHNGTSWALLDGLYCTKDGALPLPPQKKGLEQKECLQNNRMSTECGAVLWFKCARKYSRKLNRLESLEDIPLPIMYLHNTFKVEFKGFPRL